MQIISELEPVKRGPYGGAIVYYDFGGDLDSCITIRSVLIKDKKATFQAGAGVVHDSIAESEYQEIRHKSQSIKRALSMTRRQS